MRWAIAQPCIAWSPTTLRIRRSSVPCNRSVGLLIAPLGYQHEHTTRLVGKQVENDLQTVGQHAGRLWHGPPAPISPKHGLVIAPLRAARRSGRQASARRTKVGADRWSAS